MQAVTRILSDTAVIEELSESLKRLDRWASSIRFPSIEIRVPKSETNDPNPTEKPTTDNNSLASKKAADQKLNAQSLPGTPSSTDAVRQMVQSGSANMLAQNPEQAIAEFNAALASLQFPEEQRAEVLHKRDVMEQMAVAARDERMRLRAKKELEVEGCVGQDGRSLFLSGEAFSLGLRLPPGTTVKGVLSSQKGQILLADAHIQYPALGTGRNSVEVSGLQIPASRIQGENELALAA